MEQEFFRENPELTSGKKLLLAVSTGVDSMVLLDLLEQRGLTIGVAHVDHQLREESKVEAAFLRAYCQKHDIPFYLKVWKEPADKNFEAMARKMRYAFFESVMEQENYDLLVTAHHGDDQLETLLMRLTRGGSFGGHGGILRRQKFGNGFLIRPLLTFSKEEIYQYAKEQDLTYFEDVTNQSQDYFRNRIRHNVVPELKKENPQILTHAQQFHQQITWADQLIAQGLKENLNNVTFDGQRWSIAFENFPAEKGARYYFLSLLFEQIEKQTALIVSQRQLFTLLEQIQHPVSQWQIDLGGGWQIVRRYQELVIESKMSVSKGIYHLTEDSVCDLADGSRLALNKSTEHVQQGNLQIPLPMTIKLPLTIRRREAGDRIRLTQGLTKRINRYFIDQKIPTDQRERVWVVTDSTGEVVALLPFVNSYLSITTETDRIHYILDYTLNVAK